MDTSGDPYARPSNGLSEAEKRILVAAFSASSLSANSPGRNVLVPFGRSVLLSSNDKSDVLVVSFQTAQPGGFILLGLLGSQSTLFPSSSFRIRSTQTEEPVQQILLPGEKLWFKSETVGSTSLVISEVTP